MNEYELLRAELIHNSESIVQYENIMYASVAAIFAFAFQSNNYFLCLSAYVVIIPCFFVIMHRKKSTCFITSYMYVFLEGVEYHWERRAYTYNSTGNIYGFSDKTSNWKLNLKHYPWKIHFHFFMLPLVVSVITICGIWFTDFLQDYSFKRKVIWSVVIAISTLGVLITFYKNTFDYGKSRREMIEKWLKIKYRRI